MFDVMVDDEILLIFLFMCKYFEMFIGLIFCKLGINFVVYFFLNRMKRICSVFCLFLFVGVNVFNFRIGGCMFKFV